MRRLHVCGLHIQVCLPGLHISLGIFQRLYNLLEQECHHLDMLMASHKATDLSGSSATPEYEKHYRAFQRLHHLREEHSNLQTHASFLDQTVTLLAVHLPSDQVEDNIQLHIVRQEVKRCREKIKNLVYMISKQYYNTSLT